jgi:hypothetical protein
LWINLNYDSGFIVIDTFLDLAASQPGQVEELNMFKNRRTSIRRSARTGSVKGPIDPKGKLTLDRAEWASVLREIMAILKGL